jgi:hypothetical protein
LNDRVELPREEVALLIASLTACGFLVLGVLNLLWPPAPRRASARPPAKRPRPAAALPPPAPVRIERPLPPLPSVLGAGRALLDRAGAERDLERRVTILTRAVAGLTRAAQAAPDDTELAVTVASARARLWEAWEQIAQARLAAAMPWSGPEPTAPLDPATRLTAAS